MGLCEDAPDEYCGHVLEPEDAGVDRETNDAWHERTRNAVCLRKPTYDGLCVWHADTDEKTAEELVESRLTPEEVPWEAEYVKEHLNGAILRGIEFPEGFSFGGCALVSVKFPDADLHSAEFPDADLWQAEFPDADLWQAEFPDADLWQAEFPDADLGFAEFPDADLWQAEFPDAYLWQAEFPDADLWQAEFPDADLWQAEFPDADLWQAEFPDADLWQAEFPDADLRQAEFPDADLRQAEFPDADLRQAEFPDAYLHRAEFPDAYLHRAEFSDADLRGADLIRADLIRADLRDADLRDADLSDVVLSRATRIGAPREPVQADVDELNERHYDQIARANHELRTAYSANGLTGQARVARVRERKARRREAFAEGGIRGKVEWLWSILAQVFAGYGIQLRWTLGVMLLLYFGSALVYSTVGGMSPVESLYYSIVTFTTSPPEPAPTGLVMRAVAGFETFAGTAAIVFLGYVLGTRERV